MKYFLARVIDTNGAHTLMEWVAEDEEAAALGLARGWPNELLHRVELREIKYLTEPAKYEIRPVLEANKKP